jgi:hypothetical protein
MEFWYHKTRMDRFRVAFEPRRLKEMWTAPWWWVAPTAASLISELKTLDLDALNFTITVAVLQTVDRTANLAFEERWCGNVRNGPFQTVEHCEATLRISPPYSNVVCPTDTIKGTVEGA